MRWVAFNEPLKKNGNQYGRGKPIVQDSLSALLTDAKDSTATKRVIILYLTKLLLKVVPVLGLFSKRHCYN
jgi:SecD/SecF fusion protein